MSSIHSPQHPFSRCGRVGFPQTIHEDSKIALGVVVVPLHLFFVFSGSCDLQLQISFVGQTCTPNNGAA